MEKYTLCFDANLKTLFTILFFSAVSCQAFEREAKQYYDKGVDSAESGKYQDAIRYFEKTIEIAPNFAGAYNDLGDVYINVEKFIKRLDL